MLKDTNYIHPLQQRNTPNDSTDAHSQKEKRKLRNKSPATASQV
jgi:hypothetical protein